MASSANNSPSSSARASTPKRGLAPTPDESSDPKRQRMSEESEVHIEIGEPEDIGSYPDNAITIDDESDIMTYADSFDVGFHTDDSIQEIDMLCNSINPTSYFESKLFFKFNDWLQLHLKSTAVDPAEWHQRYLQDESFFSHLGMFAFKLLDAEDLFDPDCKSDGIAPTICDHFLQIYRGLFQLGLRLVPLIPAALDGTLARRDSALSSSNAPQHVPFLYYLAVMGMVLSPDTRLTRYMLSQYDCDISSILYPIAVSFLQAEAVLKSLNPTLRGLASQHRAILESWSGVCGILTTVSLTAVATPEAARLLLPGKGSEQVEEMFLIVNQLVLPVITKKHPRALPPGMHDRLVKDMANFLNLFASQLQYDDAIRFYRVCIQSDIDSLFLDSDKDAPSVASLQYLSQNDHKVMAELVKDAWLLTVLKNFVSTDIMDIRTKGMVALRTLLEASYNVHVATPQASEHPVLQYLARFLLKNEFSEYIFGPDSHAGLVKESKSVIAFFAVTKTWNEHQTEFIWQACTSSVEDEFNKASFEVLQETSQYLSMDHLLTLASKYATTPTSRLNAYAVQWLPALFARIRSYEEFWSEKEAVLRPARISFDVLKQINENHLDKIIADLRTAAFAELASLLSPRHTTEHRQAIYELCVDEIRNETPYMTTSLEILCMFLRGNPPKTEGDVILDMLPANAAIEEFCRFVQLQRQKGAGLNNLLRRKISVRLGVIIQLIGLRTEPSELELELRFWSHAIGDKALSGLIREESFELMLRTEPTTANPSSVSDFISRCTKQFLPTMSPDIATVRLVLYIDQKIGQKFGSARDGGFDKILDLPLWQQLVRIATTAKKDDIARSAIQCICNLLFVLPRTSLHGLAPAIQCQTEFVRRHVDYLEQCFGDTSFDGEQRVWRVTRGIAFLDIVLQQSKDHAEIYASPISTICTSNNECSGEACILKLQINGPLSLPGRLDVQIPNDSSLKALLKVLQDHTGVEHHDMIRGGTLVDIEDLADQTIREAGFSPASPVTVRPRYTFQSNFSKLFRPAGPTEAAILDHYDRLEGFLDGQVDIARKAYELLIKLPTPEVVRNRVASPDSPNAMLFPPTQQWRTIYSLHVLLKHLKDCNRLAIADQSFILQGARRLAELVQDRSRAMNADVLQKAIAALKCFLQGLFLSISFCDLKADGPEEHPRLSPPPPYFEDPERLALRLVELLSYAADLPAANLRQIQSKRVLARSIYATIIQLVRVEHELWPKLARSSEFVDIHGVLLLHRDETFSRDVAILVQDYAFEYSAEITSTYLRIMVDLVPDAMHHSTASEPLFQLTQNLMNQDTDFGLYEQQIRTLLDILTRVLWRYRHKETPNIGLADSALCGLLKLIQSTVSRLKSFKRPLHLQQLAEDLWDRLLFPPWERHMQLTAGDEQHDFSDLDDETVRENEKDTLKEHRPDAYSAYQPLINTNSRGICLETVRKLCESRAGLKALLDRASQVNMSVKPEGPAHSANVWIRSPTMNAGLRNLGMTCYMNSLLQQIYGSIYLRKFIMDIPITQDEKQGLLFRVQKLFSDLQNVNRPYVDTADLAKFLGVSVDTQEDVHGFYTIFMGGLEQNILDLNARNAFMKMYSGRLITQVRGDCGHVSSRAEAFSDLSITVQNKASLEASLSEFVQGEPMRGANRYKCLSCDPDNGGQLVDAIRRTCLDDVPDLLTLCLKRFTFDMMGQEQKNNDAFDFPEEIDLAQFQRKHLENPESSVEPDTFKLVGVIVHSGVLSFGHYWSYVRLRGAKDASRGRWIRLEDHNARDAAGFEEVHNECLGGNDRAYSAYVLLYERQSSIEMAHEATVSLPCDPSMTASLPPRVATPAAFENEAHEANSSLYRISHVFDPHFHEYTTGLMKDCQRYLDPAHPESTLRSPTSEAESEESIRLDLLSNSDEDDCFAQRLAELVASYFLYVLMADAGSLRLREFASALHLDMVKHPQLGDDFVSAVTRDDTFVLRTYQHSDSNFRHAVCDIFIDVLRLVGENLSHKYLMVFEGVVDCHSRLMDDDRLDGMHTRWYDYFLFAFKLAELGPSEAATVVNTYFEWIVEVLSLEYRKTDGHAFLMDRRRRDKADMSSLFEFLNAMLNMLDLSNMKDFLKRGKYKGAAALFDDVRVTRFRILPWLMTAMNRTWRLDNWQDLQSGKLVGTLAAAPFPHIRSLIYNALYTGLDFDHDWIAAYCLILHFCRRCGDTEDATMVVLKVINNTCKFGQPALHKPTLEFLDAAYEFAPEAVLNTLDQWTVKWLGPESSVGARTDRLLKKILFDPSPITEPDARPFGQQIDLIRIKKVRFLLKQCSPRLKNAYEHQAEKTDWDYMVATVQEGVTFARRLQKQVEKFFWLVDRDGDAVQDRDGLLTEIHALEQTVNASTGTLRDLSDWESSSLVDEDDEDDMEETSGFETDHSAL